MLRLMARKEFPVLFPLCVRPLLSECGIHDEVRKLGLELPVPYSEDQPHNNCRKYGCILAGIGQWANDIDINPEGFAYTEQREREFFKRTGFTACKDQRGGKTKSYPLYQIRADKEAGRKFPDDWRSQCSCMDPVIFTTDECF